MSDVISLKYPKKSHRKNVTLPGYSTQLAEFVGVMMGDGGINNSWQANITLNALKDVRYSKYLVDVCQKLFGITPAVRKRKTRNALVISLASTTIVHFLVERGLPRGNKLKAGLRIPGWILEKPVYYKACVRGLMDTDGCLFIHTHQVLGKIYKNIGLCFTNHSPELIFQVAKVFEEFGIIPHINVRGTNVFVYRAGAVERYLKVFGSSNRRITEVYEKWRGG